MASIYDYSVKDRRGNDVSLKTVEGKVLLIVNTATGCGFTPQYEGLEKLYEKYHEQGLEILDFPCNQFGHQAPGEDDEIHEFCTAKYNTQFDQFKKIEVNGENEDPLYTYLKAEQGFKGFSSLKEKALFGPICSKMDKNWKTSSNIKWNFTKFLVDREGRVVNRFESMVTPEKIEEEIVKLL